LRPFSYEADLTEFLASFRAAYSARGGSADPTILEFKCKSICTGFFSPWSDGRYRYLIQQQYVDIWRKCERRFFNFESRETRTQTVIVGTAGIGKSAARLLYIAMWLEKELIISFDAIVFNFYNDFYAVDFNGKVTSIEMWRMHKSNALLLLDPCNWLNTAQNVNIVNCKMLIVFASPDNQPSCAFLDLTSRVWST
jgi:hypothetical protein